MDPAQEPAPVQAFHRVTASIGHIYLLWHGVSALLPGHLLSHSSLTWSCFSPCPHSFCLTAASVAQASPLPLLPNSVIPEALPSLPVESELASTGSVLEPADIDSVVHQRSFQKLLREATPVFPPITQTLSHKPNKKPHLCTSILHGHLSKI